MFEEFAVSMLIFLVGASVGAAAVSLRGARDEMSLRQRIETQGKKIWRQGRMIESLLNEINRLSRRPINLDGDAGAYRDIQGARERT